MNTNKKHKERKFQRSLYAEASILAKAEQLSLDDQERDSSAFLREFLRLGLASYERKNGQIEINQELAQRYGIAN